MPRSTENAKQLRALLNTRDAARCVAEWAGQYQANVRRILDVTRTCFEIVPKTQAEMAKVVGSLLGPITGKRSNTSISLRRPSPTGATRRRLR